MYQNQKNGNNMNDILQKKIQNNESDCEIIEQDCVKDKIP